VEQKIIGVSDIESDVYDYWMDIQKLARFFIHFRDISNTVTDILFSFGKRYRSRLSKKFGKISYCQVEILLYSFSKLENNFSIESSVFNKDAIIAPPAPAPSFTNPSA